MPVQQPQHRVPCCKRFEGPIILEDIVPEEGRHVKRIAHDANEHAKGVIGSRLMNHLKGCESQKRIQNENERLD